MRGSFHLNLEFSGKVTALVFRPLSFSWAEVGPGFLPQWHVGVHCPCSPHHPLTHIDRNTSGILGLVGSKPDRGVFLSAPHISTWPMVWHMAGSR